MTQAEFEKKLKVLAETNWKVKNLLKNTKFEDLPSRIQILILDTMGLERTENPEPFQVKESGT